MQNNSGETDQRLQVGAIIRDVLIITGLTFIGGFIAGLAAPPNSQTLLIAIAASNLLLGTFGFIISGYLTAHNRWRHLIYVAIGTWLLGITNVLFFGFSFGTWIIGIIGVAAMMGIGGALASRLTSQSRRGSVLVVRLRTSTMKTHFIFILAASVLALAGCRPATVPNSPGNDTYRLDRMAQSDPQSAAFAEKVKLFYQALKNKDWATTYDMRTANFKQDVTREYYLKQMADEGKGWSLNSYKVLNIHEYSDTNGIYAAQIIMEFSEAEADPSFESALWQKEGGTWVCDEPGLSGLA